LDIITSIKTLIKTISIIDVFDILVVAFLIYNLIKIIRESRAGQLVKGIVVILCAYFLAKQLKFRMLSAVLTNLFQFSIFGILIVFQPELRRVLEHIGRSKFIDSLSIGNMSNDEFSHIKKCKKLASVISNAVYNLSNEKTGALIVFERKTKLGDIIDTGTIMKSIPSVELVCNIFYNKAPLHDGAVIVKDYLLYAGGCILPLSKNFNIKKQYGTRHRAAIGISENSDAVAVVVSEETGTISIAINGILKSYHDIKKFELELEELLAEEFASINTKGVFKSLRKVNDND